MSSPSDVCYLRTITNDFVTGSDIVLAENIECFWLSSPTGSSISSESKSSKQMAAAMDVTTSFASAPFKY